MKKKKKRSAKPIRNNPSYDRNSSDDENKEQVQSSGERNISAIKSFYSNSTHIFVANLDPKRNMEAEVEQELNRLVDSSSFITQMMAEQPERDDGSNDDSLGDVGTFSQARKRLQSTVRSSADGSGPSGVNTPQLADDNLVTDYQSVHDYGVGSSQETLLDIQLPEDEPDSLQTNQEQWKANSEINKEVIIYLFRIFSFEKMVDKLLNL